VLKNSDLLGIAHVATIDADGQHSCGDLLSVLEAAVVTKAELIVGNRLHAGNKKRHAAAPHAGQPRPLPDQPDALRHHHRGHPEGPAPGHHRGPAEHRPFTIDRYGFCSEILRRAHQKQLKVVEVPISVTYSEETLGKGQNNWGVFHLVTDLVALRVLG
jgi:hypothetical protein